MPLIRHFWSAIDTPAVTVTVTAVSYLIFLFLLLNRVSPGEFPQAADAYADPTAVPDNLYVIPNSTGYDGQFYYRYALEPFTREKEGFGIDVGSPRYRHQRILYPLLAWLGSFGEPLLAVYSMIVVNFLALVGIGWVGGRYAQAVGRHALFGLAFAVFPGFVYTLSRDLVEITEALMLLVGLLALERNRTAVSSSFLSLAILAKETALLTAVALISERRKWGTAVLPLAAYGAWQLFMNYWWRYTLESSTAKNVGWPVVGIIEGYRLGYEGERWLLAAGWLALFGLLVLWGIRRSTAGRSVKMAWALYTLLLGCLTAQVWVESLAFLRAASLFYLLGTAVLIRSKWWLAGLGWLAAVLGWLWLAGDWLAR